MVNLFVPTVGFEFEFDVGFNIAGTTIPDELGLEREYYSHMVELNKILFKNDFKTYIPDGKEWIPVASCIKKAVAKAIETAKILSRKANTTVYVGECATYYSETEAIVFNGVHLHINLHRYEQYEKTLENLDKIMQKMVARKAIELGIDFRFLVSHHVWGALRHTGYRFKRNERYKPLLMSRRNTVEIRMFSFLDLMNSPKTVAKIITETMKDGINGKIRLTRQEKEIFRALRNFRQDISRGADIEDALAGTPLVDYITFEIFEDDIRYPTVSVYEDTVTHEQKWITALVEEHEPEYEEA